MSPSLREKKKIGGASLHDDLRRIDAILEVLGDGQKLAVDANGRFDLETAIRYPTALSESGQGYITVPDLPGIGFKGKSDLHARMRELAS